MATATKKTTSTTTSTKPAAKKASTKTTPLRERELTTLIEDAGYAAAAVANDAYRTVLDLPKKFDDEINELRTDAPGFVKELPNKARTRAEEFEADVKARVEKYLDKYVDEAKTLRDKATKAVEDRIQSFEKDFDARAKDGRKVVDSLLADERVSGVVEQAKDTGNTVKSFADGLRKRADKAVDEVETSGEKLAS